MDSNAAYRDFEKGYEAHRKSWKRPTVLVAGYVGSGKTSLIQAICGKDVVPPDRVGAGLPKTQAFAFYANDVIRFFDSKGLEPGIAESRFLEDASQFVRSLQSDANVDNHIHLVWYTIQGAGARVTPCDLHLIKDIFPNVLVLITKNDITRTDQRDAMTQVLVDNGVKLDRILPCSDSDQSSLTAIVEKSHNLLPEAYRDAFVAAQMVSLEEKRGNAQKIILATAASAAVAGAVPLPFSDSFVIGPIQLTMIGGLAAVYNEPLVALQATFAPLIAEAIGTVTAATLTKFIPVLGSFINAGVAGGLTYAIGYIVDNYLAERFAARLAGKTPPAFHFAWNMFREAYEAWKKRSKE